MVKGLDRARPRKPLLLEHEAHELDAFTLEEGGLDGRGVERGAENIEDVLHELGLVGARRVPSTVALSNRSVGHQRGLGHASRGEASTYREDLQQRIDMPLLRQAFPALLDPISRQTQHEREHLGGVVSVLISVGG